VKVFLVIWAFAAPILLTLWLFNEHIHETVIEVHRIEKSHVDTLWKITVDETPILELEERVRRIEALPLIRCPRFVVNGGVENGATWTFRCER